MRTKNEWDKMIAHIEQGRVEEEERSRRFRARWNRGGGGIPTNALLETTTGDSLLETTSGDYLTET